MRFSTLFLMICLVGCDSGPSVEKVTGTVTLDGTPVPGAKVTFSPVAGGTGAPAVGTTDESGVYTVTDMNSDNYGSGAKAGDYNVGVLWYKTGNVSTANATGDSSPASNMADDRLSRTKASGPEALLPAAYGNPETSGLSASIGSGSNTFDFELDSKYKGPTGK